MPPYGWCRMLTTARTPRRRLLCFVFFLRAGNARVGKTEISRIPRKLTILDGWHNPASFLRRESNSGPSGDIPNQRYPATAFVLCPRHKMAEGLLLLYCCFTSTVNI